MLSVLRTSQRKTRPGPKGAAGGNTESQPAHTQSSSSPTALPTPSVGLSFFFCEQWCLDRVQYSLTQTAAAAVHTAAGREHK